MKQIAAFTIAALASYAIFTPKTASATYGQDYPSNMCTVISGSATLNGNLNYAAETSAGATLDCPLISNGTAISGAGIWFYSNGEPYVSVEVQACSESSYGGNYSCGAYSQYSGGAANTHLSSIDTSALSIGGFNFLIVTLAAGDEGNAYNTLYGYQLTTSGS